MVKTFKLRGLNKPWKAGGFNNIYATVEYGNEDWFHCRFDEKLFPEDRLRALFDMFKNADENLWSNSIHNVSVRFDAYSGEDWRPVNPIIKELFLDL